jgi:hypothetical protein
MKTSKIAAPDASPRRESLPAALTPRPRVPSSVALSPTFASAPGPTIAAAANNAVPLPTASADVASASIAPAVAAVAAAAAATAAATLASIPNSCVPFPG